MPTYRALLVAPSCASIQDGAPLEVEGYPGRDGPVRLRFHTEWATVSGASVPRLLVIEGDCDSGSLGLARRTLSEAALDLASLIATLANGAVDAPQLDRAYDISAGPEPHQLYKNFGMTFDTRERRSRRSPLLPMLAFVNAVRSHRDRERLLRTVRQYRLALSYWPQGLETLALAHLYMGVEALSKALLRDELERTGETQDVLAERWELSQPEREHMERSLVSQARRRLLFMGDEETHRKARAASDGFEHGFKTLNEVDALATEVRDATARYLREAALRLAFRGAVPPELLDSPYDYVLRSGPPTFEAFAELYGPVERLAPAGQRHPDLQVEMMTPEMWRTTPGKMAVRHSWVATWRLGEGTTASDPRFVVEPTPVRKDDPTTKPITTESKYLGREGSLDES